MPQILVNYTFDSDAQGFSDAGLSGPVTFAWNGSDGSPSAGCVGFSSAASVLGAEVEKARTPVLRSWEDFGVPVGATVTQVAVMGWRGRMAQSGLGVSGSVVARVVSAGAPVHANNLLTFNFSTATAPFAPVDTGGSGAQAVPAAYQASNTPVQIELMASITNALPSAVECRLDNIQLAITYTGGSGGGGGGTTMAERATVLEGMQIGIEITPGTAVAATRRLLCTQADLDPKPNIKPWRGMGFKVNTAVAKSKEYTEGKLTGDLAYNDFIYLASSLLALSATVAKPASFYTLSLGTQTSGNFTLTFNGQTTASIVFNPTAAAIAAALEALSTVGAGNVFVQATATANQFTISFQHALGTTTLALTGTFTGLGTPGNAGLTNVASTASKRWFFNPSYNQPDTVQTFTVEEGQYNVAGLGAQMAYGLVSQLGLKFTKDEAALSGAMLGRAIVDSFSLTTGGITEIAPIPVDPASVSVFAGSSTAAMTRLLRCFELDFTINPRFKPVMTLDDSQSSYSSHVEEAPDPKIKLVVERNSEGQNLLAQLRAAATQFIRVEMKGANIEAGFPYRIGITCPVKFLNINNADPDGVRSGDFEAVVVYDPGFGGWCKVEVDNALAAL